MYNGKIIEHLHALGLTAAQASMTYQMVRAEAVTDTLNMIRRFREVWTTEDGPGRAALNELLGQLMVHKHGTAPSAAELMSVVYIAHPVGGNVEENLADLRRVVAAVNRAHPNVVPFVPYYADCVSLDDDVPEDRERGIRNDTYLLRSGIVDEMWLTGPHVSRGMAAEAELAKLLGIRVVTRIGEL